MQKPTPLAVEPAPLGATQWTVRVAVEHSIKWSPQTNARPQFVALTLRAETYSGSEQAVFVNAVPPDDETLTLYREPEERQFVQSCFAGVALGVEEGLHLSAEQGFPVTGVLVTLMKLCLHPIDSNPEVCRRAAKRALMACLKRENLVKRT